MHVTSEESVKAYRSVLTSCLDSVESKLGFSHLSIFSQSAERAARAAPNGVKKGATFLLLFRSLNHTDSSRKLFNGVQKGQVHSKKHKPSKKYFCGRSTQGSPPAGLKDSYTAPDIRSSFNSACARHDDESFHHLKRKQFDCVYAISFTQFFFERRI